MKFTLCFNIICSSLILFLSCSDNDVMLYHSRESVIPEEPEEPEDVWLFTGINYTREGTLPYSRTDQFFLYDGQDRMSSFANVGSSLVNQIEYFDNYIIISRFSGSNNSMSYDTIRISLDTNKQIEYAVHTTYSKTTTAMGVERVTLTNRDSTVFIYNTQDYLQQMDHYKVRNDNTYYLAYQETYVISDGNVTKMENSENERYNYTYDEHKHAYESEFCYEVPRNVNTAATKCWTMSILPVVSDHLGLKNKNNVSAVNIEYPSGTSISSKYTNIIYNYIYGENNLLNQVRMSGMIGTSRPFDNSVMTFIHTEKETLDE